MRFSDRLPVDVAKLGEQSAQGFGEVVEPLLPQDDDVEVEVERGARASAARPRRRVGRSAHCRSTGVWSRYLSGGRLDDQRVGELASLDDPRRRQRRDNGVVVRTSHGLIEAHLDDDPRRGSSARAGTGWAQATHRSAVLQAVARHTTLEIRVRRYDSPTDG